MSDDRLVKGLRQKLENVHFNMKSVRKDRDEWKECAVAEGERRDCLAEEIENLRAEIIEAHKEIERLQSIIDLDHATE